MFAITLPSYALFEAVTPDTVNAFVVILAERSAWLVIE